MTNFSASVLSQGRFVYFYDVLCAYFDYFKLDVNIRYCNNFVHNIAICVTLPLLIPASDVAREKG